MYKLFRLIFENPESAPMGSNNDDDTITLDFDEQLLTDIFANHIVYVFFKPNPNQVLIPF